LNLRNKRIQHTVNTASVIPSKRTNLKLNLQSCNSSAKKPETMQPMQIPTSAAASQWEVEGLEFQMPWEYATEELMMMEGSEGETVESAINTPDIAAEIFKDIFKEPVNAMFEDTEPAANTEQDTEMELIDMDFTEYTWGHSSFTDSETNNLELCAPASLVEGINNSSTTEADQGKDPLLTENVDLLKWIIDDQEIDDAADDTVVAPVAERVSVIVPVDQAAVHVAPEPLIVEVKMENISEEEKYRKMREQNNEASKRCRAKRKRKLEAAEEELQMLTERNTSLMEQLASMEMKVKKLKSLVLSEIKK